MKHLALCCLLATTLGCAGGTATPAAVATATPVAATCGSAVGGQGALPGWVDAAGGHNTPTGVPFILDASDTVVGFVYAAYPLRAGHPEDPANKILWVVRYPRQGSDLTITAHPDGATSPVVRMARPADSSPGEIYPMIIDMPTAGCWVLDLGWSSHRTTLLVPYA